MCSWHWRVEAEAEEGQCWAADGVRAGGALKPNCPPAAQCFSHVLQPDCKTFNHFSLIIIQLQNVSDYFCYRKLTSLSANSASLSLNVHPELTGFKKQCELSQLFASWMLYQTDAIWVGSQATIRPVKSPNHKIISANLDMAFAKFSFPPSPPPRHDLYIFQWWRDVHIFLCVDSVKQRRM